MGFIAVSHYKMKSSRCPNKHHMDFYEGKTLVNIKIEQLLRSGCDHVYISTDDTSTKNTDHVTFIHREDYFCDESKSTWTEVTKEVFNSVPVPDDTITIYTYTMCPLFDRYDELFRKFEVSGKNQLAVYPSRHYYLDVRKRPINFMPGLWHTYSQGIDPVYQIPFCGSIAPMGDHRFACYNFPVQFEYFEIETMENLDIDTKEEFELGQMMYKWKIQKSNDRARIIQ